MDFQNFQLLDFPLPAFKIFRIAHDRGILTTNPKLHDLTPDRTMSTFAFPGKV